MRADAIGDASMTEHKINPGLTYLNIVPTPTWEMCRAYFPAKGAVHGKRWRFSFGQFLSL